MRCQSNQSLGRLNEPRDLSRNSKKLKRVVRVRPGVSYNPRWSFTDRPDQYQDIPRPRSLSDLGRTNSLCKTACTKIEAKSNENSISSLLVRLLEGNKGRYPGFHSKSAGGFAVSSLSDT